MRIRCKLIEGYRSVVDNNRGHSIVLDLPKSMGGSDTGATALELAVMGLAGCIVTIFAVVASKMKVDIKSLETIVDAEKPEGAKTITNIKVEIKVKSDAPKDVIEKIWKRTAQICPVGILFEKAGLKVKPTITLL